jgi:K+-transporting ATPase ATPase C chain
MGANDPVPVDIVTGDFSGFDPDITEAAALLQVHRVAQARGLNDDKVHALVEKYVQGRVLWIFGEPYVNVLQVNMALDNGEAK